MKISASALAKAMVSFAAFSGGCSMFGDTTGDAVAVAPQGPPTTVPSSETADYSSVSGAARELFIDTPKRVIDLFTENTATDAVRRMEDSSAPDRRRDGIVELTERDYGRGEPYTQRYLQIAQFDREPMVRATATRALNRSRYGAPSLFIAGLKDADRSVRLESAKALSNLPADEAAGPLTTVLDSGSEDLDVRIAAADALRHYKTPDVSKSLIAHLGERDFGLAWQCRQSLRYMTGQDHRFSAADWKSAAPQ